MLQAAEGYRTQIEQKEKQLAAERAKLEEAQAHANGKVASFEASLAKAQAAGEAGAKEAAALRQQLKAAVEERDEAIVKLQSAGADGGLMKVT